MAIIRRPAVAGKFYSRDAQRLQSDVRRLLDQAQTMAGCQKPGSGGEEQALSPPLLDRVKVLIVPHAGLDFSGPIAARGYAQWHNRAGNIHRVIILGTCHVPGVSVIATSGADQFETPLGLIDVDRIVAQTAINRHLAEIDDTAHESDHAIEMQLPFLQQTLRQFKIAPFLVGAVSIEKVTELLELFWDGEETAFVISTDLSHYLGYEQSRQVDRQTSDDIVHLRDGGLNRNSACGYRAISGTLRVARKKSLLCEQLDLRNSGDTAGSKQRVVGYGAFAIYENSPASAGITS